MYLIQGKFRFGSWKVWHLNQAKEVTKQRIDKFIDTALGLEITKPSEDKINQLTLSFWLTISSFSVLLEIMHLTMVKQRGKGAGQAFTDFLFKRPNTGHLSLVNNVTKQQ